MSFEIVEKSQVKREITITVPGEDIRRVENSLVSEMRKTMSMKGFRKGKVPARLVRERVGASISEDARYACLEKAARDALSGIENLLHAGEAEIVQPQTEDGGFIARLDAECTPTVELGNYKGLEIKVADVNVTDDNISEALEIRRERSAVLKPVEDRDIVEDGDVAVCTLSAPNDAASKLCRAGDRNITVGRGDINVDMEKCLIGAKVGDAVQMTARIGDAEPVVTAEIKELKRRVMPELDDEFAKDTGDAETLDGLREFIKKGLIEDAEKARKEKIDEKLCAKLREIMPVEIPEGYVRARAIQAIRLQLEQWTGKQVDDSMLSRIAENMRESEVVEYRNDYHVEVILNAIAEAEKVEVSEEDTLAEAMKWFGSSNKAQVEKWLKTNNAAHFVGDQIRRDRALNIVRDAAVVTAMTEEEIAAEKEAAEKKDEEAQA